ncbi:3-oxoacyl-ACP reductase FabG [Amycolatopsis roodepoortensis]|uniref:3-oxoacyl-ACP reductase FabG n=1 Tax=Amycolatopsis roodepoortensis TaxID=700274 RepID=UPI00214A8EAC|nr:3-oxoacyl-ACP reductase FabG [Amycolatopsis roodepoortensis]UUV35881.1 3-oxoacyl-ACP reductase FabG [Amycolatopsis roodepoortensis]
MNRRVLVTGGNRGIGLATARRFLLSGDTVAVTYRSTPPPENVPGIRCDVTDTTSVDQAVAEYEERFGPVEVLVANAGITVDRLIVRMSEEEFLSVLNTNLAGVFRAAKRVSMGMMKARWGRMVFISSVGAFFGAPGQANYAATKAGLVGFARSLAWEFGTRNITANVVSPGLIDTDMTRDLNQKRIDLLLSITPLGVMGEPDDVAHVVRFVASEEARYVTGAVIPVSGGLAMGQ